MSLDDALTKLASAGSAQELRAAHKDARKAIGADRRKALLKGTGVLARTLFEALDLRDRMKAEGASQAELDAFLETTVRETWPKGREWKYVCHDCDDTGLMMRVCRRGSRCPGISTRTDSPYDKPGKYHRLCAKDPLSDYEHSYGEPCSCAKGDRFRTKAPSPTRELAQVGKVSKPTRWGRS